MGDVTTDHVLTALKPHWLRTHETMSRIRQRVEYIFDSAKAKGLHSGDNPARWRDNLKHLLPAYSGKVKNHTALDFEQLPRFMAELCARPSISARRLEVTILTWCGPTKRWAPSLLR